MTKVRTGLGKRYTLKTSNVGSFEVAGFGEATITVENVMTNVLDGDFLGADPENMNSPQGFQDNIDEEPKKYRALSEVYDDTTEINLGLIEII